jgi:PhoH-like ATPase
MMTNKSQKKRTKVATEKVEKNTGLRRNRIFVLDTNVLLHDSNSLFAFQDVVVGIPFVVLEELDKFKRESDERGRNARQVIRDLDELRSKGSLSEGVSVDLEKGITFIKVLYTPEVSEHICEDAVDDQNLAIVAFLTKKGMHATFVTKDINARVKADALGLEAEDYLREAIDLKTFYKGWITIPVSAKDVKTTSPQKVISFVGDQPLIINQFVIIQSENNPWNARVFRFLGGKKFKEVMQPKLIGEFNI